MFNLSNTAITDIEIKVLEKGLDIALMQRNEPEIIQDFAEFCRRMRTKWFFRNEPTPKDSEVPAFSPKFSCKPQKGHPNLEVFLSQLKNEIFKMPLNEVTDLKESGRE